MDNNPPCGEEVRSGGRLFSAYSTNPVIPWKVLPLRREHLTHSQSVRRESPHTSGDQRKMAVIAKAEATRVKTAPSRPAFFDMGDRKSCLKPISKNVSTILRHGSDLREPDGAVCWPTLMHNISEHNEMTQSWIFDTWLHPLSVKRDKVRFECCLDPQGTLHDIRAIQGHCGHPRVWHTGGSRQDTHGTPVRARGTPWVAHTRRP